ncbi:MAG: glycosyltransferase, partial [Candidatus Acidiferrales bacterium]
MKTLYFAPHAFWPIHSGGRLRDYQLARQLAARGEVTFVEMRDEGEEHHGFPADPSFASIITLEKERTYTPSKMLRGLVGPTPVTVLNCWSPRAASRLAELLKFREFDTVQIEGVHLMEFLPILRMAPGAPAIVVDWHNIESELMWRFAKTSGNHLKRAAARRTAKLIERAEARLLETCTNHTVTSERERKKLLARCPGANIQIIPNGVDTRFYSAEQIGEVSHASRPSGSKPTILFVGSMDYHANIDAVLWFSRNVWPEIARNDADLKFTIVGRNPGPEVRALTSDRIHVTGTVDDIRPFYASAVASIVPIRSGSGTRLKILKAMAAGVPVISTRLGAEGIEAEDGVHLLLADTGPEIAAAVYRVASS